MTQRPATTSSERKLIFSDRALRALTPNAAATDYRDTQQPGLIARLLPTGAIQFTVRYRWQGKQRRHKLGLYGPDHVTIAKARKAARQTLAAVDAGRDPAGERQAQKRTPVDTVDALVEAYLEKYAKPRKRSAAEDERVLRADVLPRWKGRAVRSLTRRDVRDVLDRIVERGSPIAANRTFEIVRRMLNWAVEQDWIEANPASHVKKPAKEQARDRVLTDDEIRALWRCLSHFRRTEQKRAPGRKQTPNDPDDPFCPLSPRLAAVQKVRLLTAQRGGEVLRMKWADLDLDAKRWTIPASDSKNGKPHVVPLTDTVVEILTAQPRRPAKDDTPGSVYVFGGGGETDVLPAHRIARAGADLASTLGFEMRSHDLRRTAATLMVRAGVLREHVSRVLNHTPSGPVSTRVYDRHSYDPEKRVALETLERVVLGILKKKAGTKADVLPMRRA
jgi:integrase